MSLVAVIAAINSLMVNCTFICILKETTISSQTKLQQQLFLFDIRYLFKDFHASYFWFPINVGMSKNIEDESTEVLYYVVFCTRESVTLMSWMLPSFS